MQCFQMNQRKEPKAHSLLDQDLPRARQSAGSVPGILSSNLSESRGNQMGEGHNQGWADGEVPGWSERKCSCRTKRQDRRS